VLADLQRAFAAEVLGEGARLRVHRETTLGALCDALEAAYPVCARLVGAEFFRGAARRFAREVPSRSPDLSEYGAGWAEFLAGFGPARELVWLPDVARLEWALHRARSSAPCESLDPAALAAAGADLRLRPAPGTAFLSSAWPVDRIWEANQPDRDGAGVSLEEGGADLVVAREPDAARFTRVRASERDVLAALASGQTLAEAAGSWTGSGESLGALLARAVDRRWLV